MRGTFKVLWVLAPFVILGDALSTNATQAATVAEAVQVEQLAQGDAGEASAVPAPLPPAPDTRRFAKLVEAACRASGVDEALVHAVILAESSYDPNAVSTAGAAGLMQLTPETAKRHGVRDPFDPADNIRGGVKHLKGLLALFDGDVELAIAAYNAGENAVIRAGYRIPPYAETERFVPRVIGHYRRFQLRQG